MDPTWTSVHDAPFTPTPTAFHGTVRVYLNQTVMDFRAANPDPLVAPAVPGAMAVKELYDDGGNLVGHAVIYYEADMPVYYCYGPAGRCYGTSADTTMDAPDWGVGDATAVSQCSICHGGNIYTETP